MEKKDLRIVFMGTPEFAVETLKALVENEFNVVAVVTQPDKPVGRHQGEDQPSEVKKYALEHNLPVLQPEKMKDPLFIEKLRSYKANLQVVVAFRMLPEVVWDMPAYGTFNVHAALLPQYRGAAPINWAIINGEKKTGVTSFLINEVIDTGNILLQKEVAIADDETAGTLHDKLQESGSQLLLETLQLLENGKTLGIDQKTMFQNESDLKPAPKIFKDTCKINWNDSTENINNHIRGFSPYPGAWTQIEKNNTISVFKIFVAHCIIENHTLPVGVIVNKNNSIAITTQDGFIQPIEIQIEGKRRMNIHDFLNGFSFEDACIVN